MKRKTGTRIVSMVLAAQMPLSSAAQAAAPLMDQSARQDTAAMPAISFRDFIRTEEWSAGRVALAQEPLWKRLRLVTSAGDTDHTNILPADGETTPGDGDSHSPDVAAPSDGGDTDHTDTLPADGETTPGDGDSHSPDTAAPSDGDADHTDTLPGDGETPPGDGDSQNPDTAAPSDGDIDHTDTLPADGETTPGDGDSQDPDMATPSDSETEGEGSQPSLLAMPRSEDTPAPPLYFLLKMAGYGDEYSVGFSGGDGDATWNTTAKYNFEWDRKWEYVDEENYDPWEYDLGEGRFYNVPTDDEDSNGGVLTVLYGYPHEDFVDENGEPLMIWYDPYDDSGDWKLNAKVQEDFSDLPRLPNKEFDGWYIQQSLTGADDYYFDGLYWLEDYTLIKAGDSFSYEGRQGWTVADVDNGDKDILFDYTAPMINYADCVKRGDRGTLLPVIGVWKDSTNATATGLKLYLSSTDVTGENSQDPIEEFYDYNSGLLNKTAEELDAVQTTTFAGDKDKYFLRVPFDADRLNFDFTTYEPGSTVVVTSTYQRKQSVYTDSLTGEETTKTYENGDYMDYDGRQPTNTPENDPNAEDRGYEGTGPARKVFTLGSDTAPEYISLGTYNASDADTVNVITFTVTAPDGTTTATYTLYVQRLSDPTMAGDPGNTPYGMIYRERPEDSDWIAKALAKYDENKKYGTNSSFQGITFESEQNNRGNVYPGRYRTMAWGQEQNANLDEDPTAIVAYQSFPLQIPGAVVTDALGVSNPTSALDVTWELAVEVVDNMGPEVASDAYKGTTKVITGSGDAAVELPKNVKPGVYTLNYVYTDPYDRGQHSDVEHGFSRKVVVLPLPGDVDMDGTVTVADGVKLQELLDSDFAKDVSTDLTKSLYWYRVCNVDNSDSSVNAKDVELLLNGYATPPYGPTTASANYFIYLPLAGSPTNPRKQAVVTEGQAVLRVDYLGMDNGDGTLNKDLRPDYNPQTDEPFWIGARLTESDKLPASMQGDVTTFTFTLIYDPNYVELWMPENESDLLGYIMSQNPRWNGYELLASSGAKLEPATHDVSKALPALSGVEANLRELRVSLKGSGAALTTLPDGMILKVPFKLRAYPTSLMNDEKTAALIDVSLGMRDFTVTTANGAGGWNNTPEYSPNTATTNLAINLTYKGADRIPIGNNEAPGTLIQLEDKNGQKVNPVYGDAFTVSLPTPPGGTINPNSNSVVDLNTLPPGITYTSTSTTLSGTPTKAGTYSFTIETLGIGGIKEQFEYQITIDKAPLILTAKDVQMYYGQSTAEQGATTEQTFTYDKAQIKNIDVTSGKTNTGTAAELATLLNKAGDDYTAPQIALRTTASADGASVSATTVPGEYWAVISGGSSQNYKFYYVQPASDDTAETTNSDLGWAKLTIYPRPILVDELTKGENNLLGEILVTAPSAQIEGETVSYSKNEFVVAPASTDGAYGGIPLSTATVVNNDEVVLEYTASVDDFLNIKLTKNEEILPATVVDVKLTEPDSDNRNNCYVLVNLNGSEIDAHPREDGWVRPNEQKGTALVKAQELYSMSAAWRYDEGNKDFDRVYEYGTPLSLTRLSVYLRYLDVQGNPEEKELTFGNDYWAQDNTIKFYEERGVTIQWVDGKDVPPQAVESVDDYKESMAYTGQPITVPGQNGKWLCITAQGTELDPVYIGPFTVNKKELTINTVSLSRYYGESDEADDYRFTYEPKNLASWDHPSQDHPEDTKDTRAELLGLHLSGYEEPTVSFRTVNTLTGGADVDDGTNIGTYYVLLSGAKSDNYSFKYVCTNARNEETTKTATSLDPDSASEQAAPIVGYSILTILPRPIMVTKIKDAGSLVFDSEKNEITDAKAAVGNYEAVLPVKDDYYYQWEGIESKTWRMQDLSLSGPAIREGDAVTLQYHATFKKNKEQSPYWDLGDQSQLTVDVDIDKLTLSKEGQGGNYELIFAGAEPAASGWTAEKDHDASTDASAQYKQNGSTGTITRRSITAVQVLKAPTHCSYTYGGGDNDDGTLNLDGLRVKITYGNGDTQELDYQTVVNGDETTTNFAQQGLSIHWGSADGPLALYGQQLNVADHNNKQLVITGQAVSTDDQVVATLASGVNLTIAVAKRTLVLTPKDQTRAYGEDNGAYEFTFDPSALASWDKEYLTENNLSAAGLATALNTPAASAALSALDESFVGPTFTTTATKGSAVGDYNLTLSAANASMANYTLTVDKTSTAAIHVVKRPIYITAINKDPIASVSQGASTEHTADCLVGTDKDGNVQNDITLSLWTSDGLSFAGSNALVDGDLVKIKVAVKFTSTSLVGTGKEVTITGLELAEGGDKYELHANVQLGVGSKLTQGEVHEKRIAQITSYNKPKLAYTYGDTLSLENWSIDVAYEDLPDAQRWGINDLDLLEVYYYNKSSIPVQSEWASIPTTYKKAQTGDHLTVKDHDGAYLLVLAKKSNESDSGYAKPILVGPLTVDKLPLVYTLTADDKVYDATTTATGSIQFKNVYPGDKIWVDNGTDYTGKDLGNYTFTSGSTGIKFTYTSPNAGEDIWVSVSGIKLNGPDAANYDIGPANVTKDTKPTVPGRSGAPQATITKAERNAVTDVKIDLNVDAHTNTVSVSVDKPASSFGNSRDQKNSQLSYEYRLVVLDENGTPIRETDWQKSRYFGGELVNGGQGQTAMSGDKDLGKRDALERGKYVMAQVRLCETDNYLPSADTASTEDPRQAIADADQAMADAAAAVKEKERVTERVSGPVTKTYTYRVDLWDSTEVKGENNTVTYNTSLAEVWFTDLALYKTQQDFERLTGNLATSLYTGYFWDKAKKVSLSNSFDLSQDIAVKMSVEEDGASVEKTVVVNPPNALGGRDLTVYVTSVPRTETSAQQIKSLTFAAAELTAHMGDAPQQLELIVSPRNASLKNLTWTSSDPSVATVNKNGLVTFVGPGTTVITVASRSGVTASILIHVVGDSPFGDAMLDVYYDGVYMDLDGSGRFGPELTMSRHTLVTLMAQLFQPGPGREPKPAANVYDDVPANASYQEQLSLLDRWGIINGVGQNLFAPDDTATRAEVAVILCQMLMLPVGTDPNAPHAFVDATPENHWAWAYIDALAAAGITAGTGGGRFSPDDPVTRAELTTFIDKAMMTEVDMSASGLMIPVDVSSDHWAYKPILRAVNSGAVLLHKEISGKTRP